jgi:long-chain acyl-CoA synthetase
MNLAKNLERSAFFFPERPAVSEGAREMTYRQLNEKANRVATALMGMGIQVGEPVGLCTPNSGDWLTFYFGVLKAGAVAVTYSSLLKKAELEVLVGHARPRVLLAAEEKLEDLGVLRAAGAVQTVISPGGELDLPELTERGEPRFQAVDRDRTDTAVILYTGGTTGTPKGVMLSHENVNAAIHTVVFNERSTPEDRALCFLPFNHVFGQMHIMNATILSAGCLELIPSFDLEKVLDLMSTGRVSKFYAVPTVYVRLLSLEGLKEKLGAVRYCFSAAASMASEVVREWKERTGLAIYEGYGLTEAAPTVTYNHYFRHVVGSVGTEVPGVEIQIRDKEGNRKPQGEEGEICARGPNIMKGYLNNPEETRAAFWEGGWLRTGDIGFLDDQGYLYIVDRLKDMIITGGENVYPKEVEEVMYTVKEIEECAVVGLPDKTWGERVTAFIIPRPGKTFDERALHAYLKERLSSFKVPKEYRLVKDFPRSPAGKILKRELRKTAMEAVKKP